MNFISICSGIEAASVAFEPLGWKAIGFSEIEPFPCAVLAHHYPDVPNFGDMTKFREWPESVFANADAIVGGPPCQAFSIAGLRNGLEDARGNLTLVYVELINHADLIRYKHGKPPVITIYENVHGLFSDKTGAFGCFLGSLAGEDGALVPPGGRWTDAGCVFGPERTIAWRLFDAQYHGLAQRRRRVFVVASARAGFDPAAVLFEFDGVRRDIAPSREAGEEVTPTIRAGAANGGAGHGARSGDSKDELIVPVTGTLGANHGNIKAEHAWTGQLVASTGSISHCLNAGGMGRIDYETETMIVHGTQDPCTDKHLAFAMGRNSGQENVVSYSTKLHNTSSNQSGKFYKEYTVGLDVNSPPPALLTAMQVRRLTPVECEALQGFPSGYTMIPWRKKPAEDCPDGPRYNSLGNSMAVPCMFFIGSRIDAAVNAEKTTKKVSA